MNDEVQRATAVRAAAETIREAIEEREATRLAAVHRAKTEIERHVRAWEAEVRAELAAEVAKREKIGVPPSFVDLAGMSHLEKPLNRLFAWWAAPGASHGLDKGFLVRLATRAGAHGLAADVRDGQRPEIHAETAVDDSGKMPDLLVKTTGGALLLENKHGAGETGDQFSSYPILLGKWAGEVPEPERRAVLCCRRPVETSRLGGFHDIILHREVAGLFRDLSAEREATVWARIAALVTAEAFDDRDVGALLAEARRALSRADSGTASRIRTMRALCDALAARPVAQPWRDDEDTR